MSHLFAAIAELQRVPRLSHSEISSQHLVVELFGSLGLVDESLEIKDVLPSLLKDSCAVVILLVASDDDAWFKRFHFVESGNPLLTPLSIGGL